MIDAQTPTLPSTLTLPFAAPRTAIRLAPIRDSFLERARRDGIDDQGQPVVRLTAKGGEPCRDVLRRALPGEQLILASHSPFTRPGPYHEFGPVYLLAEENGEQVVRDALPVDGEPVPYLRQHFVIRAYSADEEILDAVMTGPEEAAEVIDRFFTQSDTAFLHVRFPTYGCFACRVDRA